ncbi:MAG: hypothetical protein QUS09_09120 [Methanotrichaceae archaeon]|nr:hypothetical protein [Methanotrichaceae archaeon]
MSTQSIPSCKCGSERREQVNNNGKEYTIEDAYQERYKLPCPYIGKPCIKEECAKWRVELVAVPVPGLTVPPQPKAIGKCVDDWSYDTIKAVANNLFQFFNQVLAVGRHAGGPKIFPPRG